MSNPPSVPPPIPPQRMGYQAPQDQHAQRAENYSDYQRVADTVGMVPNVRLKDNLYQLIAGAIGAVIGAIAGYIIGEGTGVIIGGLAGFVVVALLWGIGLGIVGVIRGVKKR